MAPIATHSFPTIQLLKTPTRDSWVSEALADLDTVLLDHSHCERKAAGVAMNLMFRYPSSEKLVYALTEIAQEELSHFAQVNQWLAQRGVPLRPLPAPPYGAGLSRQVRKQEPERMLDSLLVAALIEARSHERLGLLANHCADAKLAGFYRSLMASEARHYGIYWVLATTYFDRDIVSPRLEALAQVEGDLLAIPYPEPRIHS
ncbi:MAG: tRNA-(ms[2]io[6]A)-hydroxylase [Cyanobacteria bacterium]|nr:tRNA-(ms[2]io[6]A)-hydroxylase [Cyanobacteriota bacterium]